LRMEDMGFESLKLSIVWNVSKAWDKLRS